MLSRKLKIGLVFIVFTLYGCGSEIDKKALKDWVKSSVSSCSGEIIGEITLIREGKFSNKFVGFVEVKINGESYYPDIIAYADEESSFWKMEQNVCALASLQN